MSKQIYGHAWHYFKFSRQVPILSVAYANFYEFFNFKKYHYFEIEN